MTLVYRYVGILTVDVSVFHSQDSFPLMFHPWLWETSSGVFAVGVFAAEARCKGSHRTVSSSVWTVSYIHGASVLLLHDWPALGQVRASFSNPYITSLHHSSFSNPPAALTMSQLILQPFHCFTYIIGTSPTSKLILQLFCCFTYITAHSTTLPLLQLSHRHFTYVTGHSITLPLLHLGHSSFSNPSVALPTSQFVLQPFRCVT